MKSAIWQEMKKTEKRKVTPEQLAKDLETLEDEARVYLDTNVFIRLLLGEPQE